MIFAFFCPELVQTNNKSEFLTVSIDSRLDCQALHFDLMVTSETYQLYLTELQAIWIEEIRTKRLSATLIQPSFTILSPTRSHTATSSRLGNGV